MRIRHFMFTGLLALSLLPACSSEETSDIDSIESDQNEVAEAAADKADAPISNFTYYTARQDFRRCISPLCGGYFVKRVNQTYTFCPGGGPAGDPNWTTGECYVATADLGGLPVSAGLWKGRVAPKNYGTYGNYRQFIGTEAWSVAGTTAASGIFYRVNDAGIVCITYPCPTHRAAKLNSSVARVTIAGADLSRAGATQEQQDAGLAQMRLPAGTLVAGTLVTVRGPAGNARSLRATQFYLPIKATKTCYVGGCSGQVCSDRPDVITTCEFRPEYACYASATCEQQATGDCGWTKTAELSACISAATDPGFCTSDADCRLEDDYCTGCDCRALSSAQTLPIYTGPGVRCVRQPCGGLTAACVNNKCVSR